MHTHRVGILTGGGDAPGLNAVIRAFIKRAVGQLSWQVVGIEDSFNGILESPYRIQELTLHKASGLLPRGGTILGTTNRGDPFSFGPEKKDRSDDVVRAMEILGLEGLVVIGGDGTQRIALRLMQEKGVPVVGVPKTIDNDLSATDLTFGFQSAVDVATDALDRLHTTAEAHDRVMVLEVMGRDAGHIALHAGIAGGADVIVIPEIPYDVEKICRKIDQRLAVGRQFTLIVVAEGARPKGEAQGAVKGESPGQLLARSVAERRPVETRVTVLGHLQRGGSPVPFDRLLATRFGVGAADLIEQDKWGQMVALRNNEVVSVPLSEAVRLYRYVNPNDDLVRVARAVGTEFGG